MDTKQDYIVGEVYMREINLLRSMLEQSHKALADTERERQYWEAIAQDWMEKYEIQKKLANELRYVQAYADRENKVRHLVSELAGVFEIGRPMDR